MTESANMEIVGQAADTIDNLIAATKLPLPPQAHLRLLTASLQDVVKTLRQVYVAETGADPWGNTGVSK